MKRAILLLAILTAFLVLLPPIRVQARGVALGPQTLEIKNALRGGEYDTAITVFNPSEEKDFYRLRAGGEAGSWISFYEWDSKKLVPPELPVAGQNNITLLVRVNIPSDANNGTHTATIYADTASSEIIDATGISAVLRSTATLTIGVTGAQIISGEVMSITTENVEVNYPQRTTVAFNNTGNVAAILDIDVTIAPEDKTFVDKITAASNGLKPGKVQTVSVEWLTTGKPTGNYLADVSVRLNDNVLKKENLRFAVLPAGTLTRAGAFSQLRLESQPKLAALGVIEADFANTGQIDTKARFIGEVYRDRELIATVQSEEVLIPVGGTDTLKAYIKPEKPGTHEVKGQVIYEGKKTDVKSISFSVAGESAVNAGQQYTFFLPAIGFFAALIMFVIYLALRRKRKPA